MQEEPLYRQFNLEDEDELTAIIVTLLTVLILGAFFMRRFRTDDIAIDPTDTTAIAEVAQTAGLTLQGEYTNLGKLRLTGEGTPNTDLDIFLNERKVGTTSTNLYGDWQFETAVSDAGDYTAYIREPAPLGDKLKSAPFAFVVPAAIAAIPDADTPTPEPIATKTPLPSAAPVEATATPEVILPPSFDPGTNGLKANPGTYNLTGQGQPNGQVAVRANPDSEFVIVPVDETGKWRLVDGDFNLAQNYTVEVRAVDSAGEVLSDGDTASIEIIPLAAPTLIPTPLPTDPPAPTPTAEPAPIGTIIDLMDNDGRFTTILGAIETAGLTTTLQEPGPYQAFMPTNDAINALPAGALTGYLSNPELLTNLLTQHVGVDENVNPPLSIAGTDFVYADGTVNSAPTLDLQEADNGTVTALNGIILPPSTLAKPTIDDSGVPTFQGEILTIVGTGEPNASLLVELNGSPFGSVTVAEDGRWLVSGNITPGNYEIIAYQYEFVNSAGLLNAISDSVFLEVTEK